MDSTRNPTQMMDNKQSEPISASSMSICYLGPAGTYSHQVANSFRIVGHDDDDDSTTISTISRSTITQAYNSIAHPDRDGDGASCCCCIPFENSTYGLVSETVSLLNAHPRSDFIQIRGEARLPVGHSLLVNKRDYHRLKQQARRRRDDETNLNLNQDEMKDDDEELNDEELKGIGMIHSHEQALGQCSNFLTTHCPLTNRSGRRKPNPSTAQASKFIASLVDDPISKESLVNGDVEKIQDGVRIGGIQAGVDVNDEEEIINASISSEICTGVYGLKIARRNVQDRNDNTTRFFLISNSEKAHQLTSKPSTSTSTSNSKLRTLFHLERTSISISSLNSNNDSAIGESLNLLDLILSIIYKDSESGLRLRKIDRLNKNLLKSINSDATRSRVKNEIRLDESRNGLDARNGIQNKSGTDQDEEEDPESTWVNPYLIELEMDSNQSRDLEDFREKAGKIKEEFESKVSKEMEIGNANANGSGKVNEDQRFTSLLRCLGCWVF